MAKMKGWPRGRDGQGKEGMAKGMTEGKGMTKGMAKHKGIAKGIGVAKGWLRG